MSEKIISKNKRAYFDYDLQNELIAGLQLLGHEVKSIRNNTMSLKGAFVTLKDNEAWLTNAHIKQYPHANHVGSYDPKRPRKLLLNKKELEKLHSAREQKLTIVPLMVFISGPYIKIKIATAKGKKRHDKRQSIQAKDVAIDIERDIKHSARK